MSINGMNIYIINLIMLFVWRIVFEKFKGKEKAVELSIKITIFQMIFIAGLRDISVGTDTLTYSYIFDSAGTLDLRGLVKYYIETGYMIWNKLIHLLTHNYQFLLIANITVTLLAVKRYIQKYSKDQFFSLFLFITIGYFMSAMNIMRQFLALSLILFVYDFYIERKYLKTLVLSILAAMFHLSAVFILFVLLIHAILYRSKLASIKKIRCIFFCMASCVFLIIICNAENVLPVLYEMFNLKWNYKYALSGAGIEIHVFSYSLLMKIIISLLYFFLIDKLCINISERENYDFWNYVNLISCAINVLAGYLSMFSRLNLYFSVTTIIFLPNILKSFNINKFLKCFIYIGFIVLYFTSLSSDGAVPWTSCF